MSSPQSTRRCKSRDETNAKAVGLYVISKPSDSTAVHLNNLKESMQFVGKSCENKRKKTSRLTACCFDLLITLAGGPGVLREFTRNLGTRH